MQGDLTLNDGRAMPALGLGTWQLSDAQAPAVVRRGLDLGFRLVDTAAFYRNERGVGEGTKASGAFVTTKIWTDRFDDPEAALDESLALLGVGAVDLYLIHWPVPPIERNVAVWRALVALRDAGKARSIGVSNFSPEQIDRIVEATGVVPAVNQIELSPYRPQRAARTYHAAHGIVTQSWSPLGAGGALLADPAVARVAAKHRRSPAAVVIAWHLAHGLSVIPKAADPDHLAENAAAATLMLDADDMAAIDGLEERRS